MRHRLIAVLTLLFVAYVCISCGGIVDPSQNVSQTFSGTLSPGGQSPQPFTASKTGEISVKVGTLTPASTQFIGVEWVQAGNGSCNGGLMANVQFGTANTTVISTQIPNGNYCIIMYDPGTFTQPVTFSVTVSHP
jgi:hypothetical protein